MLQTMLHGLRAIALLFALASRAHAPARQNEEHVDFRVTDVLRPQPGRDEVLVWIAASVNPLDTKTFDGAAAHSKRTVKEDGRRTSAINQEKTTQHLRLLLTEHQPIPLERRS